MNTAFEAYEQLAHQDHGIEVTARLTAEGFDAALRHLDVVHIETEGQTLPFAVSVKAFTDQFNWINWSYFSQHHGLKPGQPLYLAVMPPGDYTPSRDAIPRLHQIQQHDGLIFVEYPTRPGSQIERNKGAVHMEHMLGKIGLTAHDESKDHRHYHYLNRLIPSGMTKANGDPAVEAIYAAHQSLPATERKEGIAIERGMTEEDIKAVWSFYEQSHDRISKYDPITSGFKQDELRIVLSSPEILKFISRKDRQIVNVALITDVRSGIVAELTNQAYFAKHHPDDYATGQILFSPGIFRNPNARKLEGVTSEATIGHIAEMVKRARLAPWLGYACNLSSNRVVPHLAHTVFPRHGLRVTHPGPTSEQSFGIYRLAVAKQA